MKNIRLVSIVLGSTGALLSTVFAADMVQVFKNGVVQKVDSAQLLKQYPAASVAKINPGTLRADAIVGWYDSGHNFHAEKMGTKSMGDVRANPALQRGNAVAKAGMLDVVRANGKTEQVQMTATRNPALLRADAIVGWYDSGHNYHAQKMGSKDMGNLKSNPALQKGKAIGR